MIFVNGYIHCDPHPGNILVRKNENGEAEIVMLDHGLYQVCVLNKLSYRKRFWDVLKVKMKVKLQSLGLPVNLQCSEKFEKYHQIKVIVLAMNQSLIHRNNACILHKVKFQTSEIGFSGLPGY